MRQILAFIAEMIIVSATMILLCFGVFYLAYLIFVIVGMLNGQSPT